MREHRAGTPCGNRARELSKGAERGQPGSGQPGSGKRQREHAGASPLCPQRPAKAQRQTKQAGTKSLTETRKRTQTHSNAGIECGHRKREHSAEKERGNRVREQSEGTECGNTVREQSAGTEKESRAPAARQREHAAGTRRGGFPHVPPTACQSAAPEQGSWHQEPHRNTQRTQTHSKRMPKGRNGACDKGNALTPNGLMLCLAAPPAY